MSAIDETEDEAKLAAYGDLATAMLLTLPDSALDMEIDDEKQTLFAEILVSVQLAQARQTKKVRA